MTLRSMNYLMNPDLDVLGSFIDEKFTSAKLKSYDETSNHALYEMITEKGIAMNVSFATHESNGILWLGVNDQWKPVNYYN